MIELKTILDSVTRGTKHSGYSPDSESPFTVIEGTSIEHLLLRDAIGVCLSDRSGRRFTSDLPNAAESEIETLTRCPHPAGWDLRRVLVGNPTLLREWLKLAAELGVRAPEETLPELLVRGAKDSSLRELLLPVIGARGRWLASLNPVWSWAEEREVDEESTWTHGELRERFALFQQWRRDDPVKALGRLEAVWSELKADDRAQFMDQMDIGLSMADEPFLESALSDRAGDVRSIAAELLAQIPESRLVARMAARLDGMIRIEDSRWKATRIQITLPEAFDPEWAKDGIQQKLPRGVVAGEKLWWFTQIAERVPLAWWVSKCGIAFEPLLGTNVSDGLQGPLMAAWLSAAVRFGDSESARIILREWISCKIDLLMLPVLDWERVTDPDREKAVMKLLLNANKENWKAPGLIALLETCGPVWGADLVRMVIKTLPNAYQVAVTGQSAWETMQRWDEKIPYAALPLWDAYWDRCQSHSKVEQIRETRELRKRMRFNLKGNQQHA